MVVAGVPAGYMGTNTAWGANTVCGTWDLAIFPMLVRAILPLFIGNMPGTLLLSLC